MPPHRCLTPRAHAYGLEIPISMAQTATTLPRILAGKPKKAVYASAPFDSEWSTRSIFSKEVDRSPRGRVDRIRGYRELQTSYSLSSPEEIGMFKAFSSFDRHARFLGTWVACTFLLCLSAGCTPAQNHEGTNAQKTASSESEASEPDILGALSP